MKNRTLHLSCCFLLGIASSAFSGVAIPPAPDHANKTPLALEYLSGQDVTKNESKGFQMLEAAAASGDANALCSLGAYYALGQGVPRDDAKARDLFERATEAGSTAGASNLGIFLVRGRGGERDVDRGLFLLKKAAGAGYLSSAMLLGEIYAEGAHAGGKPDYQKAYDILVGPATDGDPAAQNFIGVIFKDGRLGPDRVPEARAWLEKAAFQGNGKACFNLGQFWNPGSPEKNARVEAMRWLLLGAELGEPLSTRMVEDLRPMITEEEFVLARDLAKVTWQHVLRRKPSGSARHGTNEVGPSPDDNIR